MRLSEFANPKDYAPTAADVEDCLNQTLPNWPDRSANTLAPSVLGSKKTAAEPVDETLRSAINREPRRWRSTSQSPWREPMADRVIPPCPAFVL
jgi:hypothetical protein